MLDLDRRSFLLAAGAAPLASASGGGPLTPEQLHARIGPALDLDPGRADLLVARLRWDRSWPALVLRAGVDGALEALGEGSAPGLKLAQTGLRRGELLCVWTSSALRRGDWIVLPQSQVTIGGVRLTAAMAGAAKACLISRRQPPQGFTLAKT